MTARIALRNLIRRRRPAASLSAGGADAFFAPSSPQPPSSSSSCFRRGNCGRVPPPPAPYFRVSVRRHLARSSVPRDETPEDKARTFLLTVGHESDVADGVIAALRESGLGGEPLLSAIRGMAGRWEVGEDEGLEDLAGSVRQQLAARRGKASVKFWVVPPNAWDSGELLEVGGGKDDDASGKPIQEETPREREAMMSRAFEVEAVEGTSLTDVAKFGTSPGASTLGEYIECACSGIMACSTCHVVVDPGWFPKVGEPCEAEADMLDLAYGPRETSRLGCQLVLTEELDGMVVRIPGGANNLMDFVPFE